MTSLGHKNLPAITNKYDQVYKKHRYELVDKQIKQPSRRFLRSNLALKVIVDCGTNESCNLQRNLGFRLHDVINTKEQTVLKSIKDAFEGGDMQTQFSVLGYRIDLYFTFININLQLKLINQDMLREILVMNVKEKKREKKNLIVYLLELILMKIFATFSKK